MKRGRKAIFDEIGLKERVPHAVNLECRCSRGLVATGVSVWHCVDRLDRCAVGDVPCCQPRDPGGADGRVVASLHQRTRQLNAAVSVFEISESVLRTQHFDDAGGRDRDFAIS